MKLYYFETPNARKACGVARYLGLPVDFIHVDLGKGEHKTPDFLQLNPNGKVPVLQDEETVVWESPSIMLYLAQKAGSALWPSDPARQAEVLRWINWDTAHFGRHAGKLFWERAIKPMFNLGEPNQAEIAEATGFFTQFAAVLDNHLAERDYLLGNQLTIADFAVDSMLTVSEQAQLPIDDFANVGRWHAKMMDLPAWREAFPA